MACEEVQEARRLMIDTMSVYPNPKEKVFRED
jgi:hypothetical protein